MRIIKSSGIGAIFIVCLFSLVLLIISSCSNTTADSTVTLTWDVPTTNDDGTPFWDLAGYELFVGASPHIYGRTIKIPIGDRLLSCKEVGDNKKGLKNTTKCSYTVTGLQQGDYYFVISVYNTSGNKSGYSNEVNKTASRSIENK